MSAPLVTFLRAFQSWVSGRGWGEIFAFPALTNLLRRSLNIDQWHLVVIVPCLFLGAQWGWVNLYATPSARAPAWSAGAHAPEQLSPRQGTLALPTTLPPAWVVVVHTAGRGLYVRPHPQRAGALAAWPDGTALQALGPRALGDGYTWLQVRDPAGHIGWVAASFVAPATQAHHQMAHS